MVVTKITRIRVGQSRNNSPKGQVVGGTKITRQRLGMESQMVGTKITHPRVGQYKTNSSKGWVAQEKSSKGMDE